MVEEDMVGEVDYLMADLTTERICQVHFCQQNLDVYPKV